MISIILPTRRRPKELQRMVESARASATSAIEVIAYVDDDDPAQADVCNALGVKHVLGPRIILTECWNRCLPLAAGDILMQANDDIVFQTKGWSAIVEAEFERYEDHIVLVHGSDEGQHFNMFGAHPFVHRRWVETLGYFIPPYFSSDYGDTWLNAIANMIDRRRYVPIVIEHLHFMFTDATGRAKAPLDETYRERLTRHERDGVDRIYASKADERWRAACALGALMDPAFYPAEQVSVGPIEPPFQRPRHLNLGGAE